MVGTGVKVQVVLTAATATENLGCIGPSYPPWTRDTVMCAAENLWTRLKASTRVKHHMAHGVASEHWDKTTPPFRRCVSAATPRTKQAAGRYQSHIAYDHRSGKRKSLRALGQIWNPETWRSL